MVCLRLEGIHLVFVLLLSQVVERGGTELPSWMTSVTENRCDDGHVTGSRNEPWDCAGLLLEGVAGPQQVGLRYELVVQPATTTGDGRCVVETAGDDQDAFFVEVLPGMHGTQNLSSSIIIIVIFNTAAHLN